MIKYPCLKQCEIHTPVGIECESTISIIVDKFFFDRLFHSKLYESADLITIYENGTRIANQTIEKKITLPQSTKNLVGFHDGKIYPITRSISSEIVCGIPMNISVVKCIDRLILPIVSFQLRDDEMDMQIDDNEEYVHVPSVVNVNTKIKLSKLLHHHVADNVSKKIIESQQPSIRYRLSCNYEYTKDGDKYTLSCEVEYPTDTSLNQIYKYENELMNIMSKYHDLIIFDDLKLETLIETIIPKMENVSNYDCQYNYYWAYKWHGKKGKAIAYTDDSLSIWEDNDDIKTHKTTGNVKCFKNLCIQLEKMNDQFFVITEILATSYNQVIYYVEPHTNIQLLNHYRKLFKQQQEEVISILYKTTTIPAPDSSSLLLKHFSTRKQHSKMINNNENDNEKREGQSFSDSMEITTMYKLKVQKYDKAPKPKLFYKDIHDGWIVWQPHRNRYVKVKYPSIDLKFVGHTLDKLNGQHKSIFELDHSNSSLTLPTPSRLLNGSSGDNNVVAAPTSRLVTKKGRRKHYEIKFDYIDSNITKIPLIPGKIYEFGSDWKILRLRSDRSASSTLNEFIKFKQEIKLLKELLETNEMK